MSQEKLMVELQAELQKYYKTVKTNKVKSFLIAKGEIPVFLIAHLDTVYPSPREIMTIYYDQEQEVMWSPDGLGTDDRAGVTMIMWMLKNTNYRPYILFTTEEETNLYGAYCAAELDISPNFVIELDRQGRGESVYYNCNNKEFEEYINSFGFHTCKGSYTDISVLCPSWKCAGVNLSVGYYDEHTYCEYWSKADFLYTYTRLLDILKDNESKHRFKYIPLRGKYEKAISLSNGGTSSDTK